jgi:hypothetical protein
MTQRQDRKWAQAMDGHSAAVRRFLDAGAALSQAQWRMPIAKGKWTPAQITQHVVQTYQVLIRQLRTGQALQVQTGWLLRQILRVVVLRPIMWTRRLPPGAQAAEALLPIEGEAGQQEKLEQLRDAAATFGAELDSRRYDAAVRLTHHIFGSVTAVNGLDFVALHTDHHARQLLRHSRREVDGAPTGA